ncbi:hypothetical protein HHI36_007170 [Cryptolaemus montrouzieri]|uniref:Uncharacterized protein n=1 Tax=Cryptolaemus montrouzieri TaxID=559131 RepID=A0ABD2MNW5_9CUCU
MLTERPALTLGRPRTCCILEMCNDERHDDGHGDEDDLEKASRKKTMNGARQPPSHTFSLCITRTAYTHVFYSIRCTLIEKPQSNESLRIKTWKLNRKVENI